MEKQQAFREIAGYSALSIIYYGVSAVEYNLSSFDFVFYQAMGDELHYRYKNIDLLHQETPHFILNKFTSHPRKMVEQARWDDEYLELEDGNRTMPLYVPVFEAQTFNERLDDGESPKELVNQYLKHSEGLALFEQWKPFGPAFVKKYEGSGAIARFSSTKK